MAKRVKTKYPGIYYRIGKRRTAPGPEKVFYIVFKKHGKVHEEKAGRQYEDAMTEAKAARIRGERIDGKRPSPKEMREALEAEKNVWSIERLWEEFRDKKPDLKSLKNEKSRFDKYLKPAFGKKEPHELVPLDVDRLRLLMSRNGKSPQHIKNTLSLLRRICNFGHDKKLCRPLQFTIEMPKVHNLKTEDLSTEQLQTLFEAIEKDSHPQAGNIMRLALFTGMRRGELLKLKWDDMDFEKGFVTIRDPKGGQDQKIPLNAGARKLLQSIKKSRSGFVFPGRKGKQRRDIHKAVRHIADQAGLPKGFRPLHGLRHVYASMLASSGQVDPYTLQKLLTHKDPKMTQRYAHLRDEALKRAASVAGELIDQIIKGKEKQKTSKSQNEDEINSSFQG